MADIDHVETERLSICNDKLLEIRKRRIKEQQRRQSKKMADCRNGNLDPNSSVGKGYITEVLVAKFLGIKTCFDLTDNFCHPMYDMLEHEKFGKIDVKGSSLLHIRANYGWYVTIRRNKKPDFFFFVGYDKNRKHVKSVYIIPNGNHVNKSHTIWIPNGKHSKWDKFKESEEEVKKWDDLFHTLKLKNCQILRNGPKKKIGKRYHKEKEMEMDIIKVPSHEELEHYKKHKDEIYEKEI